MRPTLRQMTYAVTVHRLGRFGLAAEALNVSQPSLSAQIAEVEADLGLRLFRRDRGGVQATAKGEEFLRRAARILREVEDLRRAMASDLPFAGRLRLGVLPSIGPYLLPQAIRDIHGRQPGLQILVREEATRALEAGLKSGRFDLIISTPEDHPNTQQTPLFAEDLWAAFAPDDALAATKGPAGMAELAGRRFLTLGPGHRLAGQVAGLAGACGGSVAEEYEGTSLDALVLMAATGAGVAVLPELFARRQAIHHPEVLLRPLALPQARRVIALMAPPDAGEPAGRALLTEVLAEAARDLGLRPAA